MDFGKAGGVTTIQPIRIDLPSETVTTTNIEILSKLSVDIKAVMSQCIREFKIPKDTAIEIQFRAVQASILEDRFEVQENFASCMLTVRLEANFQFPDIYDGSFNALHICSNNSRYNSRRMKLENPNAKPPLTGIPSV
jgi:hypothetical protein